MYALGDWLEWMMKCEWSVAIYFGAWLPTNPAQYFIYRVYPIVSQDDYGLSQCYPNNVFKENGGVFL